MRTFEIESKETLARLLGVGSSDIDQTLLGRVRHYRIFRRVKPDGKYRVLYSPRDPLRLLQRRVKSYILDKVPLPKCVHGGVRGCSVVSNARPHLSKDIVFCLDIKDFYPSVRPLTVNAIFAALGFGPEAARLLTDITTWDNHIPQGVATSTALANLAMRTVDIRLQGLASKWGFAYTRWVDDLTLSGSRRLLDFRRLVLRIVAEEGFIVNPQKVITMHSGTRQVVAGVVVNKKLNVPKECRDSIRAELLQLNACRRREEASIDQIRGRVSWLSHVNPLLGSRLAKRLSMLSAS